MAGKKLRMTQQRQIILDELKNTYEHPSAGEVYEKVRKRIPHISLGTVYRNLEMLSSMGAIRRLDMASGQRRFDADMEEHNHIRCISCGRVEDVPPSSHASLSRILRNVSDTSGYGDIGCTIGFFGLCPECAKEEEGRKRPGKRQTH